MNEHEFTDILLFMMAAVIGGLIGGLIGFVLSRISGSDSKPKFFAVRRQGAKILQFPKR